jgi:hypothetical protein
MSDMRSPDRPLLLDVAPEWVTLQEAVYAARVSGDQVLEWADAGQIEYVSLLPGDDLDGILLRTADIRAVLGSTSQAIPAALASWDRRDEIKLDTLPPQGVKRRRVLVVMGAAIAGGLVPVRALAGKPAFRPSTEEMNPVLLRRAGKALNCKVEADPSLTVMGEAVNVDRGGNAKARPSDKHHGEGAGGASDKGHGGNGDGKDSDKDHGGGGDGKDSDKDHGGGGGGTDLSIESITVNPDPVAPGGSALITVNTSPNQDRLTFMVTASEGVLGQDPHRPGMWTWRDA